MSRKSTQDQGEDNAPANNVPSTRDEGMDSNHGATIHSLLQASNISSSSSQCSRGRKPEAESNKKDPRALQE
ncbi:unnamed protein product [Sphagnum balticum]